MIGASCFVTAAKAAEIQKTMVQKKQVLSLTCVQWRIFLPSCTHVPLDFPGQPPQVLSYLLLVVTVFSLPHPCAIRFPRLNPHKSYLSLLVVVTIFPLLHPCAS